MPFKNKLRHKSALQYRFGHLVHIVQVVVRTCAKHLQHDMHVYGTEKHLVWRKVGL